MVSKRFGAITAAVLAAMISILAIACGDGSESDTDTSLSRADVEGIVRSEMANAPEAGLTREEVAEIAQAAVVTATADSLTYEDVQKIVRESMSDMVAMTPGDGGLTRADVDAMIQAAVADIPPPVPSAPGLTAADVERIVRSAIADIPQPPQPEPGLTRAEVERIARSAMPVMPPPIPPEPSLSRAEVAQIAQRVAASIPPRSEQADYTRFFVDNATAIYDVDGLEDTLAYYNTVESVDGQWYVFIIQEDGEIIGHYNPEIIGQNLNGPIGTDANGYTFGPDMLTADEDGKWVSYVFNNPATGEVESKHSWVVRRDGLLFGSGWYTDPAEYTKLQVSNALAMYEAEGKEATVAHYNSPESLDGYWYVFVIDEEGIVVSNPNITQGVGQRNIRESVDSSGYRLGDAIADSADEDGEWVSYLHRNPATGVEDQYKHSWVVKRDGLIFGSGWYTDDPAEYTRFVVEDAIARYETDGMEATLAYYNTVESVDGQWYVFIIDEEGYTISHYNPEIRGRDPSLRVDATGYFYGDDVLSATEDGKWVSYVFKNPATGGLDSKHTWAVKHDGLIFGSGWYERAQN